MGVCLGAHKRDVVNVTSDGTANTHQPPTPRSQEPMTSLMDDDNLDDVTATGDPLTLFNSWFQRAQLTDGIRLATSACLATASSSGRPSTRVVGIKGFDKSGFKIATNGNSAKAKELNENPFASLMFYWEPLNRMVRVDGPVSKLPAEETAAIWRGLSHDAQLIHSASRQDDVIASKQAVIDRRAVLAETYADRSVSLPPNPAWCSYNLSAERWEFYDAFKSDCPDRVIFRRPAGDSKEKADGVLLHQGADGWLVERLSP